MGEKCKEKDSDCVIWHRKLRDFFKKCTEEFRRDYGLGQIDLDILLYLHHYPEASIGEISRSQSLNKGQLSLAMAKLKDMGYIDAVENEQDKRYQIYHLTPAAEKIWDRLVVSKEKMKQQLFYNFTIEEQHLFEELVARMGTNIDRILEDK